MMLFRVGHSKENMNFFQTSTCNITEFLRIFAKNKFIYAVGIKRQHRVIVSKRDKICIFNACKICFNLQECSVKTRAYLHTCAPRTRKRLVTVQTKKHAHCKTK